MPALPEASRTQKSQPELEPSRRCRVIEHRLRIVLAAGLAAVAVAAIGLFAFGAPAPVQVPTFLAHSLGAKQSAPLVRTPAKGSTVKLLDQGGVSVQQKRGATIGLEALLHGDSWAAYRHGVARNTDSGAETITVHHRTVEESLVVRQHHGTHVWSWQLHTGNWTPRIDLVGGISFASGHSVSGIVIDKPVILDAHGRNITPKGTHWTLAGSTLSLSLDDAKLPTPYVIDPIINIQAACNLGANASTTSCVTAKTTGATSMSPALPSGAAVGDVLVFAVGKSSTTENFSTPSGGTGSWTLQDAIRNGSTAAQSAIFTGVVVAGETAPSTSWTTSSVASGVLIDYTGVNQNSPVNAANGTSSAVSGTGSVTVTTTTANTLGVAAWTSGTNTAMTAGGTATPTQEYAYVQTPGSTKMAFMGEDAQIAASGASGTFTTGGATGAAYAGNVIALEPMPDGAGTLTSNVSNVANAASGQTITFTYTAASSGMFGGAVNIVVPAGWTAPRITAGTGCVSSASGAVAVAGNTIQWTGLTLAGGATATITYGAVSGGACVAGDTATATGTAGAATWTTTEKSTAAGILSAIGASPSINVYAADGTGTLTTPTANVANGASGQTITFTYTAATGGISGGAVNIVVPAGWTAPRITAGAGCVSSASGAVAVAGSTIQWTGLTLAGGATATITYGAVSGGSCVAGNAATATSTAGAATWTTTEKSVAGGALTAIASSPSINVYAADGSGTLDDTDGERCERCFGPDDHLHLHRRGRRHLRRRVNIVVPAGWTAPTIANAAGCVSSASGAVAVAGSTIQWTGLTLAGGGTATITYGAVSGGACVAGDTATATGTAGAATWTTTEKSTAGGALTAIGCEPLDQRLRR